MKFASRRKAKYQRTDYPILRPWIIDTVLTARNTLVSSKNNFTQFQLRGPLETYCESEVPGLGSCLLAVADLEKGIKAYSIFLKRYALHVSTEV